jgi:hypothetical protein
VHKTGKGIAILLGALIIGSGAYAQEMRLRGVVDRAAAECFRQVFKPLLEAEAGFRDEAAQIQANADMNACMAVRGYSPTLDCIERLRHRTPMFALGYKSTSMCWMRD